MQQAEGKQKGSKRFESDVYPQTFVITAKKGPHSFQIADAAEPSKRLTMSSEVNAERLIRLDMPELELGRNQARQIEILNRRSNQWQAAEIQKFSVDGRVLVRFVGTPWNPQWLDLSCEHYRWLV